MRPLLRHGSWAVLIAVMVGGCRGSDKLPPSTRKPPAVEDEGGMLLKTGSFQLGPAVNQDLLNSQGDGKGGFF
ncbi:MAG: hypothetical protein ACK4RK_06200 [Gemmataceae bacterium]